MIEKPRIPSSDRLDSLCEKLCEREMANQSVCEKKDVNSKLIKIPVSKQVVGPNLNIKSTNGNPSK
jgi:hypothetical protein